MNCEDKRNEDNYFQRYQWYFLVCVVIYRQLEEMVQRNNKWRSPQVQTEDIAWLRDTLPVLRTLDSREISKKHSRIHVLHID